jgi:cytochrome c551/c552
MRGVCSPFVLMGCCLLPWSGVQGAEPDFRSEIAPLLAKRCLSCHAGETPAGGLNLTSQAFAQRGGESGSALDIAQPLDSALWRRIEAAEMPPEESLSAEERALLRAWLAAGAAWSETIDPLRYSSDHRAGYDWWSLQPLTRPAVPQVGTKWARTAIDAFIAQGHAHHALTPADEAERHVLLRRLTFDLLGLPPTIEQLTEFQADEAPDAYERLVDRLLASPHYGERWGRHWLDVVRFGESHGFERDLPREHAWHYRDWVIEALNADLPYDEFVRRQLAADAWTEDDAAAKRALGFLVAGPHDTVVPVSVRMRQSMRQDELEDLIGVVGQTFLGLTTNCARCHDHKFDPVSAKDYYQLAAVFAGIEPAEPTIIPPAATARLAAWDEELKQLRQQLQQEAEPIRQAILRARVANLEDGDKESSPQPLAAWDFTQGLADLVTGRSPMSHGQPVLTSEGLVVDGKSYLSTEPLGEALTEKTLHARVRLADLEQRGGGVIGVTSLDGHVFDSITFGERQPRRWMAGSDFFRRTKDLEAPDEAEATTRFVTMTIVYAADGTITLYRDGHPYGASYATEGIQRFAAGAAKVVLGIRHIDAEGNRALQGTIASAAVYPRALTPAEVAKITQAAEIGEPEIAARLEPGAQRRRAETIERLAGLREARQALSRSAPFKIYTAALQQPGETKVLRRGNVADAGETVAPAGLNGLRSWPGDLGLRPDALEADRRKGLAGWITDTRNPLFARVMVNRLWHYHFGAGLVATPNDLGFNGGRPSHPELLDWLASELIAQGYSLKAMHRWIVTSAVYRQSSRQRDEAAAKDADNRWLWRMTPRRIDAESLRDALLVVSGELNTTMGGPSYHDFHSHFFKGTQFYDPLDEPDVKTWRRTVYRMWARGGRSPFLDTFDCPDPSTSTPKRSATTTPLQALSLLNNTLVRKLAERLARRLEDDVGSEPDRQIRQAYRLLYAREVTEDELALNRAFLAKHGLAAACRAWVNASEFLFVD